MSATTPSFTSTLTVNTTNQTPGKTFPFTVHATSNNTTCQNAQDIASPPVTLKVTDTTAASVAITSPADNSSTTSSSINVSGNASDASGIKGVTVNGNAATFTYDSGSSTSGTWTLNNVSLVCGSNKITAVATDDSDNQNTKSTEINVTRTCDTTAPTSTHLLSSAANANGWHNQNVTVTLNATDNAGGSGVKEIRYSINNGASAVYDSANKPVISTEGTTTFSYFAVDNANNTENPVNSFQIKLDKTAPTSVSGSPNRVADHNGWYNASVGFTFTGTDTLSGIDSCSTPTYSGPDGTGKTVSGSCTDKAGNPSASVASSAIDYDATAPTSVATTLNRAADHNGWYNASVGWTTNGTDATSNIASCDSGTYNGPDGTSLTVSGKCTDNAGNASAAAASAAFKYDATKPTLNPTVSPNPVVLNGNATASANASDLTSGVDSSNTGCDTVNTGTIGAGQIVSCHATDNAGNPNFANATYSVGGSFVGWLQPVDGDGTATGAVNVGKTGRTYPIKWQLKDANGNLISDTAAQALVSSMSGNTKNATCNNWSNLGTDLLEDYTTGNTALRYDATSDQFIYNYKAPSSPACQAFVVSKADGLTAKQANFNFTK